ncbi:uncharacterized protein LOC134845510 [Symsagittifera roscoffensis]|uniref:uncharacterized protein LOC134845510 n=1 Tax=Symsagittifera roscoffensis TaxID=84072 RepID=UPI00307C9B81
MNKIEKNEIDILGLREFDADVTMGLTKLADRPGEASPIQIPLEPSQYNSGTLNDEQLMVDGDWSVLDCYTGWTDVASQDNVYLDLQEGIADIHFAEILVSTTSVVGDEIAVNTCVGFYCNYYCETVVVERPGEWHRVYCASPGSFIWISNSVGFLNVCEVQVHGVLL